MDTTAIVMGLGGGLALFLFGLSLLTDTLKQVAGGGMKTLLQKMTRTRLLGATTGAVVTAIIQSSSVTTVLVVGFMTAGLLTLQQAIPVIMGANIGSTVMAQIIAFDITAWALPLIFLGFLMREFAKREVIRQVGTMVMGIGMIFLGMGAMSDATRPLRTYQPFLDALAAMDNPILGILAGAVFTAMVQSSAATTGIAIAFAGQGLISLEAGIAIAFGANIGTCATAVLAALGKPAPAKQAAAAHLVFNILGVAIWVFFIPQLATLVRDLSPAFENLQGEARMAAETPRQIANAHTIFNIINTVLFLPFSTQLATLVRRIVPDDPPSERIESKFIDEGLLETPRLAIEAAHGEVGYIGQRGLFLVERLTNFEDIEKNMELAKDLDRVHQALASYLVKIRHGDLSDKEADKVSDLQAVTEYMESANEIITHSLLPAVKEYGDHVGVAKFRESHPLDRLAEDVFRQFREVLLAYEDNDVVRAQAVIDEKKTLQQVASDTRVQLRALAESGDDAMLEAYRGYIRVVEHLQRLYYVTKRIAKRIVQTEAKMAA
ncbi:MAG: Na/Pi cotransporter family protein [Planctomycetota bacterium]